VQSPGSLRDGKARHHRHVNGDADLATGDPRQTILIVEDDRDIADASSQLLRGAGYQVLIAGHGQEALDLLGSHIVHLILLDLRLPVMDGWRFRTIQRSNPAISHIPVIAVSADGSAQAEAIDASHYLHKPFEPHHLIMAIERILLTERRKRLDEQLKEAGLLTTLGTMAATIGHEINNPLTYVLGNVQILEQQLRSACQNADAAGPELLAEARSLLGDIRTGAERIRDVVSTLQGLSQTTDVPISPVNIVNVVRTSCAVAWHQIRHRARLRMDLEAGPAVRGNEVRLGQMVLNLLINAAQAIPPGAYESNEVHVATFARGDEMVIEVSDSGVGIPPELQARVFDPFFTTKGRLEGTGIGLTVSRNIVQEHSGRIELSSRPGAGTTFRVFLPVHGAEQVRPGTAERNGFRAAGNGPSDPAAPGQRHCPAAAGRTRVLVVDDDVLVLSTIVRILSQEHEVETATSGRQALRILNSQPAFQVILCDVVMPEMTGIQFSAELENQHRGADSHIIFMTGASRTPEVLAFRRCSQNAWLEKPFSMDTLLETVRETIRRSPAMANPG
jgi:signal transduction histidine kinase